MCPQESLPVKAIRLHVPGHRDLKVIVRSAAQLRFKDPIVATNPRPYMRQKAIPTACKFTRVTNILCRQRPECAVFPAKVLHENLSVHPKLKRRLCVATLDAGQLQQLTVPKVQPLPF